MNLEPSVRKAFRTGSNYAPTHGGVTVHPDGANGYLAGYAWSESMGWIRLGAGTGPYANTAANNYGVNLDAAGNLSGYAWSEVGGWINFNPTHSRVTIDTETGSFDGYAWSEFCGWIHFKNDNPAYNVRIDKTGQVITFAAIPEQFVTNIFSLSATASSGLPVSFTNTPGSPVVWQDATTVTFSATGTVGIVASQAGDADWNAAPSVTNIFAVRRAHPQTTDFGGEGVSDIAVYCEATGRWYAWSLDGGLILWEATLGGPGFSPVPGDYNGNGRADLAVYKDGLWYAQGTDGIWILNGESFGGADFIPLVGDFDGDGIADLTVYHEGTGYWYCRTAAGVLLMWAQRWGGPGFQPVSGDYGGRGRSDMAVYANGYWFIRTMEGETLVSGQSWGGPDFTPVPGDYNGDGKADFAVYHEESGYWFILGMDGELILWAERWGGPGFEPVPGDYSADGISDLAVYANGYWYIKGVDGEVIMFGGSLGGEDYAPVGR